MRENRVSQSGFSGARQFPTERDAQAFASAVEDDFEARAPAKNSARHTLAALIDKYRKTAPPNAASECLAYLFRYFYLRGYAAAMGDLEAGCNEGHWIRMSRWVLDNLR